MLPNAATPCGGVAADGAVGQRDRAVVVVQAAAVVAGGVVADGAVGQRERAEVLFRPPPYAGGVAADGTVGQRAVLPELLNTPPPRLAGVAADGAVGQRSSAEVVQAAAVAGGAGVAPGDRQPRERCRQRRR